MAGVTAMDEQRDVFPVQRPSWTPSVLIVDDEPSIREFLAWVLGDEGFHVTTAGDGHEALAKVQESPPDLIVTDLMMPRMDGFDLIDRLRRDQAPVKAIIAMSAINAPKNREPEADLFIAKPFEVEQVLTSVQSLLDCPPPRD